MNQEQKSVAKIRNDEHVKTLREVGRVKEEVIALVEVDLKFGLSVEQTNRYMKSNMDITQMRIYSQCLRNGYSEEVLNVITAKGMSGYQMSVALEFFEKGVPLECIQAVVERDDTAVAMKAAYQKILEKLERVKPEETTELVEPEYVKSLMEEIRNVVAKIDFQEKRYDTLNEKLKIFESTKKDEEVRDNLVDTLEEKDQLLIDQQDKINQANTTIARLRNDMEAKEKEMGTMQTKVSDMEAELSENKRLVCDYREKADSGIAKATEKSITKSVLGVEAPANRKEASNLYRIPAYYSIPVVDEEGRVIQTVPVEPIQKKSKSVASLIAKIGFKKKSRQDIVKLVAGGELVPEQLIQIRIAIEKGLKENQLFELIHNKIPADHMKEIIEIAVLENSMEY